MDILNNSCVEIKTKILEYLSIIDLYNIYDYDRDIIHKILIKKSRKEWVELSKTKNISEEFIIKYLDYVDLLAISMYGKLSINFIEKYENKLYMLYIYIFQDLTEEYIRKNRNNIIWIPISQYQKLSEQFIIEHKKYVDWYNILLYQQISPKFIRFNKYRIDYYIYKQNNYLNNIFETIRNTKTKDKLMYNYYKFINLFKNKTIFINNYIS
ncbi:tryptophan repeat gene family [Adoxophyes honmai entomopoxvirus 'L']|uniref:Tryptophan repeat gene family n=1 Tax=Adoxophyes honmai entomopoxvirus 'L' TaxID=1293540 RepID=A0A916P617_9POXV|nr:tryptophan repeat gene family [Adoxophyes honmai entomopoxvirus 'L']CCU55335.1 tryptophan repeat gene family [Adoxophyes honmai entomopoxvirus 'L']